MINFNKRIDRAVRVAAIAHKNHTRKGANLPYIIHPFGTMLIASNATDDEDTLIACLFHDIIEDVPNEYSREQMKSEFGEKVLRIVLDVTKDDSIKDWRKRSEAYLEHLGSEACDEAVLVCAADKINNLQSKLTDYDKLGDDIWKLFTTKSKEDQLWWYTSVLDVIKRRNVPAILVDQLQAKLQELKTIINR